jgi:hypothetical protein
MSSGQFCSQQAHRFNANSSTVYVLLKASTISIMATAGELRYRGVYRIGNKWKVSLPAIVNVTI